MEKSTFGERLRIAFGNDKQAEIARKMGVSQAAIKNYVAGRVPDAEKLLAIKYLTNCSLDWLLSGEETQNVKLPALKPELLTRLETIAAEQSNVVFGDADIASGNLEAKTLDLLVEYLVARALRSANLIDNETDVMTAADLKRGQRFTFIANLPQSLDDRILELVERKSVSQVAQTDGLRDMIRELIKEEIEPKKRRLYTIDEGHSEQKPRKKTG